MEAERLNQIEGTVADLRTRLSELRSIFDVDVKERRLEEVGQALEDPKVWEDPKRAGTWPREEKRRSDRAEDAHARISRARFWRIVRDGP